MSKSIPIQEIISEYAPKLKDAYAYVFDEGETRFLFKSRTNTKIESWILTLSRTKGIDDMLEASGQTHLTLPCPDAKRTLYFRKLAAQLFFGVCVDSDANEMAQVKRLMRVHQKPD